MNTQTTNHEPATVTKPYRVRARVTDLWREFDGGWSENGASVTEKVFSFKAGTSDLTVARTIRKHFGMGLDWRVDHWCGGDWVWRSGCMGCYADVIDDGISD